MVPTFDKFMFPVLKLLKDGVVRRNKEIQAEMATEFNLTEADLQEQTPGGGSKFTGNVNWAITFLYQAGLTTKPRNGRHTISQSGLDYLASGATTLTERELVHRYGHVSPRFFCVKVDENGATPEPAPTTEKRTPEELIHEAVNKLEEALIAELLNKVKEVDPKDFERLVVELLVKMGYGGSIEDAGSVTQYTGDEGIDGIIKEDVLGLDTIYLQAMRYASGTVGRPELQAFVGALSPKHAKKGVFITTSTFTPQAVDYARAAEAKIILVDGHQLCKYMLQFGLGVTTREVIELKSIDTDYFNFE